MRAIKARGNRSTEARFRSILIRAAIRGWKLQPKGVLGKPDFYFPDQRVAIFVDRCFWHGCPECGHIPKGNRPYWEAKIDRNRERDSQTTACLLESGYVVVRFWEHELQHDMANCLQRIGLDHGVGHPPGGLWTMPQHSSTGGKAHARTPTSY